MQLDKSEETKTAVESKKFRSLFSMDKLLTTKNILIGSIFVSIVGIVIANSLPKQPNEQEHTTDSNSEQTEVVENKIDSINHDNKDESLTDDSLGVDNKSSQADTCPDSKSSSCVIIYTDPGSGEVIIFTPNKVPETADTEKQTIILGDAKFKDWLQPVQLQAFWDSFHAFAENQETPIKEISISKESIKSIVENDDGSSSVNFEITVNRKIPLKAKITFMGLKKFNGLEVYSNDYNKTLYDSTK